jgi:hypothetical protein
MSKKYPRTYHLPQSPGCTSDDKRLENIDNFLGKEVVFTEKMDGSNVCVEREGCYARSHNGAPSHPSFDLFKATHSSVKNNISNGIQIFGEWLFAKHSIFYNDLPNYFMIFGIRENDIWFSWEDVELFSADLGFPTVPVIQKKLFDPNDILNIFPPKCGAESEGFVVRWVEQFKDEDFGKYVAKFVRDGHVQTSEHWTKQKIVKNQLRSFV